MAISIMIYVSGTMFGIANDAGTGDERRVELRGRSDVECYGIGYQIEASRFIDGKYDLFLKSSESSDVRCG